MVCTRTGEMVSKKIYLKEQPVPAIRKPEVRSVHMRHLSPWKGIARAFIICSVVTIPLKSFSQSCPTEWCTHSPAVKWLPCGYSGGAGGYAFIGGSFSANPSGHALNLGVGFGGVSANPGIINSYQGNLFGDPGP